MPKLWFKQRQRGSVTVVGTAATSGSSTISDTVTGASVNVTSAGKMETQAAIPDLHTTFQDVLKELKIMNLHLSVMTDNQFSNEDVET